MAKVKLSELIDGYSHSSQDRGGFLSREITGSLRVNNSGRLVRQTNNVFSGLTGVFAYTPMRTYGMALLSMGLFSLFIHLAAFYFFKTEVMTSTLVIGIVFAVLGVSMVFSDKPLTQAIRSLAVTDYIFFEFFCMRRGTGREQRRGIHPVFGLLVGFGLAVAGYFTSVVAVVLVLAAFIYAVIGLMSPEFSFFATLMLMPYLTFFDEPTIVLAAMVLVTVISFTAKVVLGKRVCYFEQYDVLLTLFVIFVLVSGIFVKGIGSFYSSVAIALFSLGYVISSSLISNRRLADNMLNSVVISSIPMAVFVTVQGVMWVVENGGVTGYVGLGGVFESTTALAELMLVSGVLCIYFIRTAHTASVRIGYAVVLTVNVSALLATDTLWAVVAVIFAALAGLMSRARYGSGIMIGLLCILAYMLLAVPPQWLATLDDIPVLSRLGLYETAVLWRSCLPMLSDNLLCGVGMGSGSFTEEAAQYGIPWATDSGNLFLEVGIEAGVFALAALLLMLAVRLRHRLKYSVYVRDSRVMDTVSAVCAATVGLIVLGVTGYLWRDLTVMYLFWCLLGTSSALLRDAKRETDDRANYFSDARSPDSSSVDIGLR